MAAPQCPDDAELPMMTSCRCSLQMYRLDRVLSPSEGQPAVGHEVLPLIEAAMDGSSAAVVLYGAKSSGKAFTAIGEKKKRLSYCSAMVSRLLRL